MIFEGDLGDVSLASLIQLMGTHQRSGGLVLRRPGQSGTVYFVDGEIIDAVAGTSRGEEAVFQLLSWDEASFQLQKELRAPGRSIQASWKRLLFDSMRKIDEGKHQDEIEDEFVALMSSLEQILVKLRALKAAPRRDSADREALILYGELVNLAAEFWASLSEHGDRLSRLETLLAERAQTDPAARLLEVNNNVLSRQHLEVVWRSLASPSGAEGEIVELSVVAVCGALLDILERFLESIVQRFRSPELIEHWSETCSFFVVEIRATLELVQLQARPRKPYV